MRNLLFIMLLCGNIGVLAAADFPEKAGIYLVSPDSTEKKIGDVSFTPVAGDGTSIKVDIDNSQFTEHFLSMRPFRCIEGGTEWFCYLEYPYDLRSVITENDLSDLEYQLLFLRKTASEFGIDAWNGLYYKLQLETDGSMSGTLLEGDLNSLQSPPAEKYAKPVDLGEFIDGDSERRLFPALRIY